MIGRYCSMTLIAAALAAPTLALAANPVLAQSATPPASSVPPGANDARGQGVPPASQVPAMPAPQAAPADEMRRDGGSEFMKRWQGDKKALEDELGTGHDRAHYRQTLERLGFAVTATNKDEPDYLEYEVVAGKDTYEVQVKFDKDTGRSTKVDVTANPVRDAATKRVLSGERR